MAIATNVYSTETVTSLLENYLVGKRLLGIEVDGLSLCTNAEIIMLGKTNDQTEIWMTVEGIGTLYFERARIAVTDNR